MTVISVLLKSAQEVKDKQSSKILEKFQRTIKDLLLGRKTPEGKKNAEETETLVENRDHEEEGDEDREGNGELEEEDGNEDREVENPKKLQKSKAKKKQSTKVSNHIYFFSHFFIDLIFLLRTLIFTLKYLVGKDIFFSICVWLHYLLNIYSIYIC